MKQIKSFTERIKKTPVSHEILPDNRGKTTGNFKMKINALPQKTEKASLCWQDCAMVLTAC